MISQMLNVYFFEVPRGCSNNKLSVLYRAIEDLAKCRIFVTGADVCKTEKY